jgi:hypothetical protein
VLKAGVLRGVREVAGLGEFSFRRHVGPVKRHTKSAVGASEPSLEALDIIDVRRDHLGAQRREPSRLLGARVAGQRAGGKRARLVTENCPDHPATLSTGCSSHRDDLFVGHCFLTDINLASYEL